MKVIILLILTSLLVAGAFLVAFFWAVSDGQYDDEHTPAMRLLVDSDMLSPEENTENNNYITIKQDEHGTNGDI